MQANAGARVLAWGRGHLYADLSLPQPGRAAELPGKTRGVSSGGARICPARGRTRKEAAAGVHTSVTWPMLAPPPSSSLSAKLPNGIGAIVATAAISSAAAATGMPADVLGCAMRMICGANAAVLSARSAAWPRG